MLGIAIGNGAVVALAAIGEGTRQSTLQQFDALGPDVIYVSLSSTRVRRTVTKAAKPLLLADAEAIAEQVRGLSAVAPESQAEQLLSYGRENLNVQVMGTSADYLQVKNYRLAAGRFLTPLDLKRSNQVVVLGSSVAERLFGPENPVGQSIRIRNISFDVIGVLAHRGVLFGTDYDDTAIVPLTMMRQQLIGWQVPYGIPISRIGLLPTRPEQSSTVTFQVQNLLQQRHPGAAPNDIRVSPQATILETSQKTDDEITRLLTVIASISLLVGGIGVMNVMLVSVTERTQEIGLRKALGAKRGDILGQFLLEAVILTGMGGSMGILLTLTGLWVAIELSSLVAVVTLTPILISLLVSCGIGLFFGVFPARQAAKLDPINALRGTG